VVNANQSKHAGQGALIVSPEELCLIKTRIEARANLDDWCNKAKQRRQVKQKDDLKKENAVKKKLV